MTFYIQGRPEGATPLPSEIGYYEAFSHWMQEKLSQLPELSLDEAIAWTKDQAECVWERSKQTFKYLSGAPVAAPPLPDSAEQENKAEKLEENKGWNFAGMFSSLKGSRGNSDPLAKVDSRSFTEGEVHADLVRVSTTASLNPFHALKVCQNNDGYFVFRYLLVDIPSESICRARELFLKQDCRYKRL